MKKFIKDLNIWEEFIKGVTPLSKNIHVNHIPKPKITIRHRIRRPDYLDLHGYTLNEAFSELEKFFEEKYYEGIRNIKIITGASGQIRQDFPYWMENPKLKRYYSSYSQINSGSFLIKIKKQK